MIGGKGRNFKLSEPRKTPVFRPEISGERADASTADRLRLFVVDMIDNSIYTAIHEKDIYVQAIHRETHETTTPAD
jgi:hypothetical protein